MKVWQHEKQRLWDILLQRVTSGSEPVRVRDLHNKGYPETFEALARLYAERRLLEESPIQIQDETRFDPHDDEVQHSLDELEKKISVTRILSNQELKEIANSAIPLAFDILTRPRQTLLEKLFDAHESQQVSDLLTVLSGFGEGRPFIERLMRALEAWSPDDISQMDFVTLASDVEKEVYKTTPLSAFMNEIDLMLKFEGAITGETHFVVKSEILLGLLKERGLDDMAEALRDEAQSKEFWTPDEIENALERFILVGGFEETKPHEEETELELFSEQETERQEALDFRLPQSRSAEEKSEADTTHADFSESTKTQSGGMIQFAEDSDAETETDVVEEEDRAEAVEAADSAGNGQSDEDHAQSELPSLFDLIQPDDRQTFLEKIFDDNATDYYSFMQKLDGTDTWRDAKEMIDEELQKRGIHPHATEAVLLSDLVFSRYQSQNSD